MFTEWGPGEEIKYLIGWMVVGIVAVMSVLNLGIVLKEIIRALLLTVVKYYRRAKYAVKKKLGNCFEKKEEDSVEKLRKGVKPIEKIQEKQPHRRVN